MKRCVAAFFAIIMLACFIFGACTNSGPHGEVVPTPEPQNSPAETVPAGNENTPVPTPASTEKTEADVAFEEIAEEIFISTIISDGLTFHQMCVDPASYGIEEEDIERGWGEVSYETSMEGYAENDAILDELTSIDRTKLSAANRIAYDNLMEAIELTNELRDYYYYDEPLTPFNGAQTMLPLIMTMYEINTAEDAENYIILLEDMPRYIGQIAAFEREKAAHGLFMTENALDQVITSCNKFIDEGSSCFLIGYFEDVLDDAPFTLTESEKSSLLDRSRSCVLNGIIPTYRDLAETLDSLRGSCRPMKGAAERSEDEKRYYELQLKSEAALNASADKIAQLLDSYSEKMLSKLIAIMMQDPSAASIFGNQISSGDPETDIAYLKRLIENCYPAIPEQKIDFVTIPDAVADDFSPAAYLISAFDDPSRNVVMFNPTADNRTMLFTLAHECFPGHLYQTQYFRNSTVPLVQQALAPTAYLEGWAVFSELMVAGMASKYNTNACLVEQYNDILCNIMIPAYISIMVNCEGWQEAEIRDYLIGFGLNDDDYVDILREYAVDVPLYFFNYAMGFVNTYRIYEKVKPQSDSELLSFFESYLGAGPCYYDILNEKFGVK